MHSVAFYPTCLNLSSKDDYVDAYLRVIKNADPLRTSLVFSCGMGAVRTTFAMTAACLVRRRQLMSRGLPDPYGAKLLNGSHPVSGINTVSQNQNLMFNLLTSEVACDPAKWLRGMFPGSSIEQWSIGLYRRHRRACLARPRFAKRLSKQMRNKTLIARSLV
jgi:Inositol hexakisphosphate